MAYQIDFLNGKTDKLAKEFYLLNRDKMFSVLNLDTGSGKTAIAIRFASLLKENGFLKDSDEPLKVIIIAPRKKIDEGGWQKTFAQFRDNVSDNELKIVDIITPETFGIRYSYNQKSMRDWKNDAKDQLLKNVRNWGIKNELRDELGNDMAVFIEYCKRVICKNDNNKINKMIEKSEAYRQRALDKTGKDLGRGFSFYNYYTNIEPVNLKKFISKKITIDKMIEKYQMNEENSLIIIDECHMFKDPNSLRGKGLRHIIKHYQIPMIGLTATPYSNGMLKDGKGYVIYNGFYKSVNDIWKTHNMTRFDANHQPAPFKRDGMTVDENVFENYNLFKERILQTVMTPDYVVDETMIPNLIPHLIRYDVSENTGRHLFELAKRYKNREYEYAISYLTDVRKAVAKDKNHLLKLREILESKTFKQPLIFYKYNSELGDDPRDYPNVPIKEIPNKGILCMLKLLGKRYSIINGKHSFESVDINDLNQCIVIQIQAGASAIEFKESNASIFYSLNDSYQDLKQAVGRNRRFGTYYDLDQYYLSSYTPDDIRIFNRLTLKKQHYFKNNEDAVKDYTSKKMTDEELAEYIMKQTLNEK